MATKTKFTVEKKTENIPVVKQSEFKKKFRVVYIDGEPIEIEPGGTVYTPNQCFETDDEKEYKTYLKEKDIKLDNEIKKKEIVKELISIDRVDTKLSLADIDSEIFKAALAMKKNAEYPKVLLVEQGINFIPKDDIEKDKLLAIKLCGEPAIEVEYETWI